MQLLTYSTNHHTHSPAPKPRKAPKRVQNPVVSKDKKTKKMKKKKKKGAGSVAGSSLAGSVMGDDDDDDASVISRCVPCPMLRHAMHTDCGLTIYVYPPALSTVHPPALPNNTDFSHSTTFISLA